MNRIWISRHGAIPVREQLSAQLLFGILSRRFAPAERLPSVRDLARRLSVHPNTVSAAYRDLAARGWVKRKAGSGVFVRDLEHIDSENEIDTFVRAWTEEALSRGFSLEAVGAAFERARGESKRHGLMVVHPDRAFAHILAAELEEAVGVAVPFATPDEAPGMPGFGTSLLLTTTTGAAAVSQLRPTAHRVIPLKPIEEVLRGVRAPSTPVLIVIVSRSGTILEWASRLTPALGLVGSDLIQRNPDRPNWRQGLAACDLVAADVLAARELPKKIRPIVLRLISDAFLEEARRLVTAEKQ